MGRRIRICEKISSKLKFVLNTDFMDVYLNDYLTHSVFPVFYLANQIKKISKIYKNKSISILTDELIPESIDIPFYGIPSSENVYASNRLLIKSTLAVLKKSDLKFKIIKNKFNFYKEIRNSILVVHRLRTLFIGILFPIFFVISNFFLKLIAKSKKVKNPKIYKFNHTGILIHTLHQAKIASSTSYLDNKKNIFIYSPQLLNLNNFNKKFIKNIFDINLNLKLIPLRIIIKSFLKTFFVNLGYLKCLIYNLFLGKLNTKLKTCFFLFDLS